MFSSLMPQRREFFDLLAAHSDRVVAGANAALRLIKASARTQRRYRYAGQEVHTTRRVPTRSRST